MHENENKVYWAEAVWREVYSTCVSVKPCKFIKIEMVYVRGGGKVGSFAHSSWGETEPTDRFVFVFLALQRTVTTIIHW